jgi:hypothetical protein
MTSDSDRDGYPPWILSFVGVAAALLAGACLHFLCWSYVPDQAGRLAGVTVALPLSTRLAIAISTWYLRVLPFLIIAVAVLAPVVGLVAIAVTIVLARGEPRWPLRVLGALLLSVAAGAAVLCAILFYGIHAAPIPVGG